VYAHCSNEESLLNSLEKVYQPLAGFIRIFFLLSTFKVILHHFTLKVSFERNLERDFFRGDSINILKIFFFNFYCTSQYKGIKFSSTFFI